MILESEKIHKIKVVGLKDGVQLVEDVVADILSFSKKLDRSILRGDISSHGLYNTNF